MSSRPHRGQAQFYNGQLEQQSHGMNTEEGYLSASDPFLIELSLPVAISPAT